MAASRGVRVVSTGGRWRVEARRWCLTGGRLRSAAMERIELALRDVGRGARWAACGGGDCSAADRRGGGERMSRPFILQSRRHHASRPQPPSAGLGVAELGASAAAGTHCTTSTPPWLPKLASAAPRPSKLSPCPFAHSGLAAGNSVSPWCPRARRGQAPCRRSTSPPAALRRGSSEKTERWV